MHYSSEGAIKVTSLEGNMTSSQPYDGSMLLILHQVYSDWLFAAQVLLQQSLQTTTNKSHIVKHILIAGFKEQSQRAWGISPDLFPQWAGRNSAYLV
jgi:hypothetical protein